MGYAMVDFYCDSFRQVPRRIVLDVDDTFDAAHGGQQLRLFNAYYDEYGFQPIVVFDGDGRLIGAVLRPARPTGRARDRDSAASPDRGACAPTGRASRSCCAATATTAPPRCCASAAPSGWTTPSASRRRPRCAAISAAWRQSTTARFAAAGAGGEKLRRFKEFYDGAASWDRVERIIARVEAGPEGVDTRFIVTSLDGGSPRTIYEKVYCHRGQAENHIKSFKTHLAADRTSCHRATANQMRLFLHAGAYWMMWSLRALMPRRSSWRVMQFDTLRLRLMKVAARVVDLKRQIKLHLPTCHRTRQSSRCCWDACRV